MKNSRELLWLLLILSVVALAVAYTPYEVAVPRRLAVETPTAYSPTPTPETFSFYCSGSRHAKSYTDVHGPKSEFPPYCAESGLLDRP
ncbi:hypothetical protein ABS71_17700 [bacterium SCN 62-11]|nr:hypothetical protein [Candidatus Eremiobacteraeota bacterium]ODT59749.1 MAG: hypothetical protein ABS71_17700 [bacterium SCN 62-11]